MAMKLSAADYVIKPVARAHLEKLFRETLLTGKGRHQEGEGVLLF
jgi:YesN/AraC family two-component response regulator